MTLDDSLQQTDVQEDVAASSPAPGRRAPNTATTARFVLLIALFVVSSLFMMPTLWAALAQPGDLARDCSLDGSGSAPGISSAQNYLLTNTPLFYSCLARLDILGHVFGLGYYLAIVVPLLLAAALYLLQPWWIRRFTRAVWIAKDLFPPALAAELNALAAVSGLSPGKRLSFLVDATAGSANAFVFGRPGRYTVVLGSGMSTQLRGDPDAFKATVLHEFAHIRNRDVDIAYLTLAVWRVFLAAVLVPFAAVNLWWLARGLLSAHGSDGALAGTWPQLLRGIVLAGFMVAMMYLATADTLRTREMCADSQAVDHGAERHCWSQRSLELPAAAPRASGTGRGATLMRAVRAALATHPDWAERADALDDRHALFTVRALPMFLTGAAIDMLSFELSFSPPSQSAMISAQRFGWFEHLVSALPSVLPSTMLAVAIAGTLVWREVIHRVDAGLTPPSGLRAGLWFGVGHLAGEVLVGQLLSGWVLASPRILMLLLPALVPMALLWWTAGCARLWARLPARRRRVAAAATLAVGALTFAWWYQLWLEWTVVYLAKYVIKTSSILAEFYPGWGGSTALRAIATLNLAILPAFGGMAIWVTVGLWLVPLAGALRRRRPVFGPPEASEEILLLPVPADLPPPRAPQRGRTARIRLSAKGLRALAGPTLIGVAGGASTVTGILTVTALVHTSISRFPQAPIASYELDITVATGWYFALSLVGVCLSAAVAAVVGKGRVIDAISAAYGAMTVVIVVLFALADTDGCVRPLALVYDRCTVQSAVGWNILRQFLPYLIGTVGIASLVIAAPASAIARLASKPAPALEARARPKIDSLWRRARLPTALAATSVVLLAASTAGFVQDESNKVSATVQFTTPMNPTASAQLTLNTEIIHWLNDGGQDLILAYEKDRAAVDASVSSAGVVHLRTMTKTCTALQALAHQAQAYPPIPVADLQRIWEDTLATTATQTQRCLNALKPVNFTDLNAALDALNPQPDPVGAIFMKLVSLESTTS